MKPLDLTFPHPFLVNHIAANIVRDTIYVELMKALQEPWPCEFQPNEKSKVVANSLKPWEENAG